jgi:hypothetical protein
MGQYVAPGLDPSPLPCRSRNAPRNLSTLFEGSRACDTVPEPAVGDAVTRPGLAWVSVSYADTPEEVALRGFRQEDQASVVNVEHRRYDDDLIARFGDLGHAVVQVGFPGKSAYYYIPAYHFPEGWRLEMPPEGDPRRRRGT